MNVNRFDDSAKYSKESLERRALKRKLNQQSWGKEDYSLHAKTIEAIFNVDLECSHEAKAFSKKSIMCSNRQKSSLREPPLVESDEKVDEILNSL